LADAHRTRKAATREAEHAVARRADESPRSRGPQLARTVSRRLSERRGTDLARPLFPRRDRQADRRDLEQADVVLSRQLREVRPAEDRAARAARIGLQESARSDRTTRSLYQPVPSASDEGQASTEPNQGAREDRADRSSAG